MVRTDDCGKRNMVGRLKVMTSTISVERETVSTWITCNLWPMPRMCAVGCEVGW